MQADTTASMPGTSKRLEKYQPRLGENGQALPFTNSQKDRVTGLPYSGFAKYTAIEQTATDTSEAWPKRRKSRGKGKSTGKGKAKERKQGLLGKSRQLRKVEAKGSLRETGSKQMTSC